MSMFRVCALCGILNEPVSRGHWMALEGTRIFADDIFSPVNS